MDETDDGPVPSDADMARLIPVLSLRNDFDGSGVTEESKLLFLIL